MNPEDYVSYPIALALKKAGLDWVCTSFYNNLDKELWEGGEMNWNNGVDCSAPLLWQAQKWLREKCGIHINICIYSDYSTDADGKVCDRWDFWGVDLYAVSGGGMMEEGDGEYDSYEQALSAGIAAALELIEEEGE